MKKIGAIFAAAALALSLHATPALADQPLDTIQITGTASRTAVSYTHLTLPTICSV